MQFRMDLTYHNYDSSLHHLNLANTKSDTLDTIEVAGSQGQIKEQDRKLC
jgi:hypothetical protein